MKSGGARLLLHMTCWLLTFSVMTSPEVLAQESSQSGRTGPPVRILPGERDENPPRQRGVERESARENPGGPTGDRPAIRQEDLPPPDFEAFGVLSVEEGGFGLDMWQGTSRALVESLLPRLPERSPSATVRSLVRRLLLTPAQPPEGSARGTDILAVRARKLFAMGKLEDVVRLLEAVPDEAAGPDRRRYEIEARLLLGDTERACARLDAVSRQRTSSYLDRATVACQALTGHHDRAELGLMVMREQDEPLSDVFATLVEALKPAAEVELSSLGEPDAYTTALLLGGGLPLPADFVSAPGPAFMRAAALSEKGPRTRRIAAAEAAARAGALEPERLAALYRALPLREAVLAAAPRVRLADYDIVHRALLFQAAEARQNPQARLEVLVHWWRLAEASDAPGEAALVSRLTVPLMANIRPDTSLREHAGVAGRAAFMAGRFDEAIGWYQLLANSELRNQEALARLAMLARLSGRPSEFGPGELEAWVDAHRRADREEATRRVVFLYALMDGLGFAQAQREMWVPYVPGQDMMRLESADADVLRQMLAAAEAREKGKVLLLILTAAGNRPLNELTPDAMRASLVALRQIGLAAEARQLAVEAALARGL